MRDQRKRHLKKKAAAIAVVDTKKAPDLQAEEKWNIIAWCMQYYDGQRMADRTYEAAAVDERRWWY